MSTKHGIDYAGKLAICILLACAQAMAAELFEKSEVMIPMRDGIKLHTVIFTPADRSAPLPILFQRTPYGAPSDERCVSPSFEFLINDGYILAFQDIRGRFKSEGDYRSACRS